MEYHIRCDPADISRYVFVPGSHERAQQIAEHFEERRTVSESRGYQVFSGRIGGTFLTVSSTGMGGPSTAIALEELGHMGADTFIRIGSCGTLQESLAVGDVIIATGTYRGGGTASKYLPPEFPAVPNFDLTLALEQAARQFGYKVHTGPGLAEDAFFAAGDPGRRALLAQAGVLSIEMESDTLFVLSALRGWRAAALFANDGTAKEIKPVWGEQAFRQGEQHAIQIGIAAMLATAAADQELVAHGG